LSKSTAKLYELLKNPDTANDSLEIKDSINDMIEKAQAVLSVATLSTVGVAAAALLGGKRRRNTRGRGDRHRGD
jgi:hypothetical protein